MKRKISGILFGLMFLLGFAILIYPTVSNQWNTYRQNQLISSYEELIGKMAEEDFTRNGRKRMLLMIRLSITIYLVMFLEKMETILKIPNTGRF